MPLGSLIKPLGITTYVVLVLTILTGLFRAKIENHKFLAFLALTLATIHAGIIIFLSR